MTAAPRPRLPDAVQSLPETLAFWAKQTPDAPAIVVPGSPTMTYAELWDRTQAIAAGLVAAGTRREDRVVLFLPEGVPLVEAMLGTIFAALVVPLPAALTAPELDEALHSVQAASALVAPGIAPDLRACFVSGTGFHFWSLAGRRTGNGAARNLPGRTRMSWPSCGTPPAQPADRNAPRADMNSSSPTAAVSGTHFVWVRKIARPSSRR